MICGVLAGLVILAGAGYGAYYLVSSNDRSTGTQTTSSPAAASLTTLPSAEASTVSSAPVTPTSAPSSTTSTTLTNLPPEMLSIISTPEDVDVVITLQDGTPLTGKAPFTQEVPGGHLTMEFSKEDYNNATRELELAQATEFKVWLDPEGQLYETVVRFKCGLNPKQVAFSPDGKELWVSFLGGNGLGVYAPTTGEKLGAVQMGQNGAVELIFTKDGSTVYASQMETASVWEIDRVTHAVKRTFDTGGSWTKVMVLSPDEKTMWASNWVSNDVSEIDLVTGEVVRRIPTVTTPRGLYVTSDSRVLYVAGYEHGDIQRIDLATGRGTVIFQTGGAMRHMVADESLGLLYVDDMSTNEVYVVDLLTDQVSKLANTDQRPNSMDLSPDGRVLYVSNRGKDNPSSYYLPGPEWGTVLALDTGTGLVLDAIVGGNQCTGLDVSPDGTLLAFSDFLDHKIRVYAIPGYETLAAGEGGRAELRYNDRVKD